MSHLAIECVSVCNKHTDTHATYQAVGGIEPGLPKCQASTLPLRYGGFKLRSLFPTQKVGASTRQKAIENTA